MNPLIPLAALLPVALVYFYGLGKTAPERLGLSALAAGAVALIAASAVEYLADAALRAAALGPVANAAARALTVAAIPEEGTKFLAFLWVIRRRPQDLVMPDLVMPALSVAMGFAALENLAYLFAEPNWTATALMRGAVTVPAHGIFGLVMGSCATLARQRRLSPGLVLLAPLLLHAAFDFPALVHTNAPELGWPLALLALVTAGGGLGAIVWINRALPPATVPRPLWQRPIAALLILGGVAALLTGAALQRDGGGTLAEIAWAALLLGALPLTLGLDLWRIRSQPDLRAFNATSPER